MNWHLHGALADRQVNTEEDDHGQRKVEGRTGHDHDESLPERVRVEAPGPRPHAPIHAGELDEAAERDGAHRVQRLAALPTDQLGAEADAELLDLDAGKLGGQEVTRFVDDHQAAEDQNHERNEQHRAHAGSLLRSRLAPSTEVRTWARAQRSAATTAPSANSSVAAPPPPPPTTE